MSNVYVQKLKKENTSIEDILKALSDNKALVLFNTIPLAADVNDVIQIQTRKIGLTRRQYYSRLSRLTETGLIIRKNGRYFLTLLGKIVYEIHVTTCEVLRYHWKLIAVESIQMPAPGCVRLPEEEFSRLVDILIDNSKIKNMVMNATTSMVNSEKYLRHTEKQEEQEMKVQLRSL
jgi:hypothetical protein